MILGGETSVLPAFGVKGTFFYEHQRLLDLGLKGVEVSFTAEEYGGRMWVGKLTKGKIKKTQELLSQFDRVGIHAGFMGGLSLLSAHPKIRKITLEEYFRNLETAPQIGAKAVTFHDGAKGASVTPEQAEAWMTEAMNKMDEKAGEYNTRVCWETGSAFFCPLERFERIRQMGLKHTGICLDTGHLMMVWRKMDPQSRIKTYSEFIERYGDILWHLHITDWQEEPKGKHKWNDHHAVGDGEINWKEVFSSLVKIGYDGLLTMEYHPDGIPDEAYLRRNCEYIRILVREAGGKIV